MTDAPPTEQQRVAAALGDANTGEGFCLLAEGKLPQAKTFFQGRLDDPTESAAATLGLAETQLALGELRAAQIGFAKVSASDHRSRDRVARALIGLAQTTVQLGDSESESTRTQYLQDVMTRYGDTPAARQASELLGQ